MLKYLLLPVIVAGALLVPTKPASAYRGYGHGYRGPRVYARPYFNRPRPYIAPRVIVRPTYNRAGVYIAPGNYYGTGYGAGYYGPGYYQPNAYYQSYGW